MIVGCKNNNENKLVCNYQNDNEEYKVTIYFKSNESINYEKVTNILFDNSIQASNYVIEDNYNSVKVVDNKVSTYINEKLDNMSKNEVKSLYEKSGYTCK